MADSAEVGDATPLNLSVLSSFPKSPEDFDADPRVSFSKVSNKFILETDDGEEFEYDDALKRWIPALDDALLEQQRQAYAIHGLDESEPAQANKKDKRKKDAYVNGDEDLGFRSKKSKPNAKEPRERKNTAIYITNLPLSPAPTSSELQTVFSRCGVIAEEIDSGAPRVKLYTNPSDGSFKGDALIVYFRAESVDLAVQMLDDSELRLGSGEGNMRVSAADFSYKKVKEDNGEDGTGGEAARKKGAGDRDRDKQKIIKKTQKLNNKLADWSSPSPSGSDTERNSSASKFKSTVILKHMFTLDELASDPASILDIKEDIRDECGKWGTVTNVILYDLEEDGVASVRFSDVDAAKACIKVMDGRHFDGRIVKAYIPTHDEKFQRTKERKSAAELAGVGVEDDEDGNEAARLDEFGAWLEQG